MDLQEALDLVTGSVDYEIWYLQEGGAGIRDADIERLRTARMEIRIEIRKIITSPWYSQYTCKKRPHWLATCIDGKDCPDYVEKAS